jgi:hypothetical protein
MLTTQKQIRALFWETFPNLPRRKITDYTGAGKMWHTDTRTAFVDFLDALHREGRISDALADRATL